MGENDKKAVNGSAAAADGGANGENTNMNDGNGAGSPGAGNGGNGSSQQQNDGVDYEAQLAEERALRQKAEEDRDNYKQGMTNAKDKLKKVQGGKADDANDDDEDDDIGTVIEKAVQTGIQKGLGIAAGATADEMVVGMTQNPKEREAILYYYKNVIQKSGVDRAHIQADLELARTLANRKKTQQTVNELKEGIKSKNSTGTSSGGNNQDRGNDGVKEEKDLPKLSPLEQSILSRRNLGAKDVKKNIQDRGPAARYPEQ